MTKLAIILLSGGLDSTTVAYIAKSQGYELYALSFDYGQRHRIELDAAQKIAATLGVARHVTLALDLRAFGGSALTSDIAVPKDRCEAALNQGIPITYVPARNTIFLSLALGWAEALGAADIFLGVNALDYSGYPDCRPDYIAAFKRLALLATKKGVEGTWDLQLHTPLIAMNKAQIIRTGVALGLDYSQTLSCYDPSPTGAACGHCDSCLLRKKGFAEAGIADPTRYTTPHPISDE
jgi:7-cyano-7-deazaguanine synthase